MMEMEQEVEYWFDHRDEDITKEIAKQNFLRKFPGQGMQFDKIWDGLQAVDVEDYLFNCKFADEPEY